MEENRKKALVAALGQIEKQFGKGSVMRLGDANSYDVELALGGSEALDRLAHDDRWDAILCDLMMPQVDGVAIFEWVSEHRAALADRMLFCTGGAFTPRGTAPLRPGLAKTRSKSSALAST